MDYVFSNYFTPPRYGNSLKKVRVGRSSWLCSLMRPPLLSCARRGVSIRHQEAHQGARHQSRDERHEDHHREYCWSNDAEIVADIECDELNKSSGIHECPDHKRFTPR